MKQTVRVSRLMNWSFRIARVFGIELRVHATFLLLLLWIGSSQAIHGGLANALGGVLIVLLVFGCVVLHELGHALAARRFGIRTPDITLLPIGGVAHLERIPENPREELVVAAAGPVVSAVLSALFWSASGFSTLHWDRQGEGDSWGIASPNSLMTYLTSINLGLVLFNLLPAFPMDGGRILRACLSFRMGRPEATRLAAKIGQVLAVGLGVAGLLLPAPILVLIAFFVYFGAANEAASSELLRASRGLRVRDAMVTSFGHLSPLCKLGDAAGLLQHSSQHDIPLCADTGEFFGLLTRNALILGLQQSGPDAPALSYAKTDLPTVIPDLLFSEAFQLMQQHQTPTLPVIDQKKRLVGLFSQEKVGELLLLESARKAHH